MSRVGKTEAVWDGPVVTLDQKTLCGVLTLGLQQYPALAAMLGENKVSANVTQVMAEDGRGRIKAPSVFVVRLGPVVAVR